MNKENLRKWIDALRSGEYTQGTRRLRGDGTYCCLGVLCDVYKKETKEGVWIVRPHKLDTFYMFEVGDTQETTKPNAAVLQWLGIDGLLSIPFYETYTLMGINDTLDWSFEMIADVLEKEYLSE